MTDARGVTRNEPRHGLRARLDRQRRAGLRHPRAGRRRHRRHRNAGVDRRSRHHHQGARPRSLAPTPMGGVGPRRIAQPIDVIKLPILDDWHIALVTPHVRVETKAARAILPMEWARGEWITQMANVAAMVHAFATGDGALLRRALDDRYAEPRRASLIPHFYEVKQAALDAGAFGCSISGSGPTVFAIAAKDDVSRIAAPMQEALDEVATNVHVAPIAQQGVRRV